MSTRNTPDHAATPSTSSPRGPAQGRNEAAQDDDASTPNYTSVFVTGNSVIVATPGFTRIENTELGRTHYGDPLPDETRRALEVAAYHGR